LKVKKQKKMTMENVRFEVTSTDNRLFEPRLLCIEASLTSAEIRRLKIQAKRCGSDKGRPVKSKWGAGCKKEEA
jgi:hypothetical protein